MMKQIVGDSIKVFVRARPLNQKQKNTQNCLKFDASSIQMRDNDPDHRFSFDHVFGYETKQEEVYQLVGHEVVESAFQGFNGTVFAYGQTSSGKTHTCLGPDYNDPEKQGILPRMITHIFDKIQKAPTYIEFRIKISVVEIYLEKIKDLLDTRKTDLKIREKAGKGIYIQDVSEEYVASAEQTMELLKKGIGNRAVGQTNMNDTSSRSHMAFIVTLYQNNLKDLSAKSGKIILVDLAGSQKVSKTGAEGKLLDQAKQINKSLSALGNVINSLTESKITHIPYRDSKLTRLLQQSLGGNSKTNLIINVSPSQVNEQQTLSSLRFGNRAKQIKNKPKINKQYTVAELLLLLEKSEKRVQELEQYIKEMNIDPNTSMKKKRSTLKKQVYVQNLLDSDNPILQSEHEAHINTSEQKKQKEALTKILENDDDQLDKSVNKSINKSIKKLHFESEYQESESEVENQVKYESEKKKVFLTEDKILEINKQMVQEKEILCDQIQALNMEKVEMVRQLDIMTQKYDIMLKETKINANKMQYLTKQNEKLLEKAVNEGLAYQESVIKIKQLQKEIEEYEDEILKLAAIQESASSKEKAVMNMFGTSSKSSNKNDGKISEQTKKMVDLVKKNKSKKAQFDGQEMLVLDVVEERIAKQIQENAAKEDQINQLKKRVKQSEQQLQLFHNLQNAKQNFIKEKLAFSQERERLYKDLENRIEKVLELQQKLDESSEKIKYYEELIKMGESEKSKKINLLQQHLNQVSESYYVLKGQQNSWLNNNKKTETKIETKNKRIAKLQKEVMNLKEQVENLKLQLEDLEQDQDGRKSILDLDFSRIDQEDNNDDQNNKGNIVKVLKSSARFSVQDVFGI